MNRTLARLSAALFTGVLLWSAAPASAHVGVDSTDAARGGSGTVEFRVPNESATATTTKVVVALPEATPFAFVTAGMIPGWTITIDREQLDKPMKVGDFTVSEAVRSITWTATGAGMGASQFAQFALSGGPFPDADEIVFTVEQTYDDGKVVNWDQPQTGDEEPEFPAPTLVLAEGGNDHHGGSDAAATEETGDVSSNGVSTWLAGGALVVAAAALVVALRNNRSRA